MAIENARLLHHDEVTGSLYFQLLPGKYEAGRCWTDDSVYIKEEVFGYLERVVSRHVPEFNHWAFTNVSRKQWIALLQGLTQFASQLDAATEMDGIRADLHILFGDSEERFAADFATNARAFVALIREVSAWVTEQLKTHDGVAILGI